MPKFFTQISGVDRHVTISGREGDHLIHVLRARPGDEIILCDGDGHDYLGQIVAIQSDGVEVRVVNQSASDAEPDVKITLFQGLPKGDKMDFIIQKAVELGVHEIVPMLTDRTIVKLHGKEGKKKERYAKIAEAAAKQSMRGIIPQISDFMTVRESIAYGRRCECILVPYENEQRLGIREFLKKKTLASAGVMIGPEGGFSPDEVSLFHENHLPLVTLGKRILRTETAGMAAAIMILYEWEAL